MSFHLFATLITKVAILIVLLIATVEVLPQQACAQSQSLDSAVSAQTDSLCGGPIRPRRGTYLVETYPSPAMHGQSVTIQYYNLDPQVIGLRVVDILDRTVTSGELQTASLTAGGLHTFAFSSQGLATGTYFIRLTIYTSTGALDQVQDSRFVIIH